MQVAALVLQLVGAVVTGVGLSVAYIAARDGLTICQWIQQWLNRGKAHTVNVDEPATAHAEMYPPTVSVTYPHDPSLRMDEQVRRLALTVEQSQADISRLREDAREDRHNVSDNLALIAARIETLDADTQERLRRLVIDQRHRGVIDLSWAATGLFITAVGLGLALFDLCR
jgi:hypothetical protein